MNDDRTELELQVSTNQIEILLDARVFTGVLKENDGKFGPLVGGHVVELDPGQYNIRGIVGSDTKGDETAQH